MAYQSPYSYYAGGQTMLAMTSQPQASYAHKYGPHSIGSYEGYNLDRTRRHHYPNHHQQYETQSEKAPSKHRRKHSGSQRSRDASFFDTSRHSVVKEQPGKADDSDKRHWRSGLCDCTQDMQTCACVWCCSPWYQCYLLERDFEESCWAGVCLGVSMSFLAARYRFRDRHNIQGSLFEDCCAATFCQPCMVCQLKREKDMVERGPPPTAAAALNNSHNHTLGGHMEQRAQVYRYV